MWQAIVFHSNLPTPFCSGLAPKSLGWCIEAEIPILSSKLSGQCGHSQYVNKSRHESINVHSICPDNQVRFMCHPSPLSRRLWRKLSGHKLESTTENFHKNFTFKKFTFHHMKVSEWLKMYSISQSYISPPIIVSLIQILQRTWSSSGFSLKRTKAQSQQC